MLDADLIIIGAGPAGMSAARRAAEAELSVLLLDEQPAPGGQIYRDVDRASAARGDILGKDFTVGKTLTKALGHERITHVKGAVVWQIEDGNRVAFTQDGKAALATGQRILLATGALERPMPVPGWTLPGVMTAGSAQILLKQSGITCARAALVGSGPLLYLVAAQMVRAGVPPLALIETQTKSDLTRSLRHFGGALRGWPYLLKGLRMLVALRRASIPRYVGATHIAIEGDQYAQGVAFRIGNTKHRIACDTVLLHHGVIPNTQAARSIDVPHRWDDVQSCFAPECDEWGRTAVATVFIAGDGAGIGGAKAAAYAGEISALEIARDLNKMTEMARDSTARNLRRNLASERAARPFIDSAYPPYAGALKPADDTIICRCEEVSAGDIRRMAGLGCLGPNQTKSFGRSGMGPCQGRYCGLSVTQILSDANNISPSETGYYRIRPPLKPITLGEIATMVKSETIEVRK
ncbi:NAD(P)/FAD-dependent oxidoreductase [Roseovarius sp. M141]|uniref:FAD/NAD(P)-dependent oxidoreductase n=1 Tax=Roseovarius sp. M141 TaxID=2583806 RepID=UPI0020CE4893|nr:NAD(P)/FAD-dependent oxidoreductase [Roseovarius sp. M141]MCQ0091263.1 FAD-binding protein [Roseovarius sp. M141]